MKKLTYSALAALFREHESNRGSNEPMIGYIVFTTNSFSKEYPLESRTYVVSSDNKAYQAGKKGYSIYGSCLDGTDSYVRLDWYMQEEKGPKEGWRVEYCYI